LLPVSDVHPAFAVNEPADDYLELLSAARQVAAHIVRTPADGLTGAAAYIRRASQDLVNAVPSPHQDALGQVGAVFECLRRVGTVWAHLAAGKIEGEQVFSGDPGLWKRAMTEWPMGGFARMAADFMIEHDLLSGSVVELGAGVGSCSALVASHVTERYIRTDLQPFLLKRQKIAGTVERYDFNEPGPWRDVDTVFAVNTLHCARDKVATLRNLHAMLRPGGVLVLGEGRPHTDDHTPWALNAFFGLFRGWWDIGGFVPRTGWFAALRQAGFSHLGFAARLAGKHDLGGAIWAVK
jgi:hypothetical protein